MTAASMSGDRCPAIGRISDSADKVGRNSDMRRSNLMRSRGGRLAEILISAIGMSLPRQVLPGQFYMVTRRCTQRMFLLRPDAETNNALTYCLIEAAQRCQVEVILPCALSKQSLPRRVVRSVGQVSRIPRAFS
jgi:hypothetical protein